jgi:putative phage-type endonuclease
MNNELRSKGIGGSEVAAILGLDDFSSPYKVWLNKTGRESNSVDNKYTKAGLILESAVADYFETETKYRIIKTSSNQKTFVHPIHQFAVGTPDRLYFSTKVSGKGVLECKTTQMTFDNVPDKWFMQLQWYLGIIGLKYGGVAWLEHGLDFKYKEYEFDREFFKYMIEAVRKFWTENVQKDIPPEPINSTDVELMFSKHREGGVIQATPEIISVHNELVSVKSAIKELESKESVLTESLKLVMRDNEAIMSGMKPLVTWRSSKPSETFDRDKFRLDHPEIYNSYLKEVPGTRRFLVKNI